ncbi:hypothetical protein [Pontibacter diazotrophicus]|uniref:hypothetical protein n=1 Tax=Pontibacter diazotrophicus TaxID=1400979 RepID=UPI001FE365EE|nr:hypothetical protein [Pontibacter diazotrophicus]
MVPKQEQPQVDREAIYTIKEGFHYADINSYKRRTTDRLRFSVVFDSTAIYTTADPDNQGDINKLYGLSDCGSAHHTNSARFGWRWYNGKLELHAYTYFNNERNAAYVGSVTLGEPAICEIRMENKKYVFYLNGKSVSLPRACTGTGEGYQLYPYFGGDETAPHDVTITIRELPEVMI